jgi:mercuric ion binding protein
MRAFSKLLMLSIIAVLAAGNVNAAPDDEQTVSFTVEKMTCASCPIAVRKAMERVDGVLDVNVDLESKTAVVTFDASKTDTTAIGSASTNVGFPATVQGDRDR